MSQDKPSAAKNKRAAPKAPKKITETYLHNAGLYYLQRFAASSAQFRSVMQRKVRKSCAFHTDQDLQNALSLVEALVVKFQNAGLLDDKIYAKNLATSLRRQGKSQKAILSKLKHKGIEESLGRKKLQILDHEQHDDSAKAELQAALNFIRKKKLGPFRINEKLDIKKELSMMARAGFSYDTSRRVLNLESNADEIF